MAEEYGVALVRSAADTRFAEQHGGSRYFVLEAVLGGASGEAAIGRD